MHLVGLYRTIEEWISPFLTVLLFRRSRVLVLCDGTTVFSSRCWFRFSFSCCGFGDIYQVRLTLATARSSKILTSMYLKTDSTQRCAIPTCNPFVCDWGKYPGCKSCHWRLSKYLCAELTLNSVQSPVVWLVACRTKETGVRIIIFGFGFTVWPTPSHGGRWLPMQRTCEKAFHIADHVAEAVM